MKNTNFTFITKWFMGLVLCVSLFGIQGGLNAQTFPGTTGPIPATGTSGTATFTCNVTASGFVTAGSIESVCIEWDHTWNSDLDVTLIAPDGTSLELFTDVGGTGDNGDICIDDNAAGPIPVGCTFGACGDCFCGDFQTEDGTLLNTAFNGIQANGTWTLEIVDDAGGDSGNLDAWSITIGTLAQPTCTIDCPDDLTVSASPFFCGADVTIPLPSVDPSCVGGGTASASSPVTPYNGTSTLLNTPTTLTGAVNATGDVTLTVEFNGDHDIAGLENFVLEDPDGNLIFDVNGAQCTDASASVTVPQATWNGWIATYGSDLDFLLLANTFMNFNLGGCTYQYQVLASIPVPATTVFTNDYNGTENASDTYPVGTTTVTFTTFDQAGFPITCSFDVTVIDDVGPVFQNCPNDITFNLDPGACDQIFSYGPLEVVDNCPPATFSFNQNTNWPPSNPIGSFTCAIGNPDTISSWRVFDFDNLLGGAGFINDIDVYIRNSDGSDFEINIYESSTAVPTLASLTQIYSQTANVGVIPFAAPSTQVNVQLDQPVQASGFVVVEFKCFGSVLPDNGVVISSDFLQGETAPSYVSGCAATAPGILADITNVDNFTTAQAFAFQINGFTGTTTIEQVDNSGLTSGDAFPIGTTTQTWEASDADGNISICEFTVTVQEFPNPIQSLFCNDNVTIALEGENCMEVLNADQLLEGGPYGCYDDYIVSPPTVDASDIGSTITVTVTDPETGNSCTTELTVIDNLIPSLVCSDYEVDCNDDISPGVVDLPDTDDLTVTVTPGTPLTAGVPGVVEFQVGGVPGTFAQITDVDVSALNITHTWVGDLSATLESPSGTVVNLFPNNIGCANDNMEVSFDDESANANALFVGQCNATPPAKEGDYQPQGSLADIDGEDPNGTWLLSVADAFFGDDGTVDLAEIQIDATSQNGLPLPLPDDANATQVDANTWTVTNFDPCGPVTLTFVDEVEEQDCNSQFTSIVTRTWTAVDPSGNTTSCTETINVRRLGLEAVTTPPNFDDIDEPALDCENADLDPSNTGMPGGLCSNVNFTFEDVQIPICEGSFKVLRQWTLVDWCTQDILNYNQIIKVLDKNGPNLTAPAPATFNANSNCEANIPLPAPNVSDACSDNVSVTITDADGNTYAVGDIVVGLGLGTHVFTYVATDDCGNESDPAEYVVTVEDLSPPVPICDEQTTVSLGSDGTADLCWPTVDDGSYDNCEIVAFRLKRMDAPNNVPFTECVTFDCDDCGETIMVRMRVYDQVNPFGTFPENDPTARFNECMVEVEVQDKLDPVIACPPNKILDCWEFEEDVFDGVSATQNPDPSNPWPPVSVGGVQVGFYPGATDNCEVEGVTITQNINIDQCGEGQVTRIYTATDKVGNSVSCVQIITINNSTPFNITDVTCFNENPNDGVIWPCDITLDECGPGLSPEDLDSEPVIIEDLCDLVGVSFEDTELPITPPGCIKLLRKWIVVDWCQPDPSFPLGYVTWEYIQEIKVLESAPPTIDGCDDVTICGFEPDCEPIPAELSVQGADDCTEDEDLIYFYKIDAFNDGVFDVDSDFNPFADAGNADNEANGSYPIGTHLIFWKVEDGCGNITTCEYLFTIQDCKPPTPICIDGLATVVMPNSGQVTLEALFFEDQGNTFDNCTPFEELIFSFTNPPVFNAQGELISDTLTFTCSQPQGLGLNAVTIWVFDEYGNADVCTTTVDIQDPTGVCSDSLVGGDIAGTIATEFDATVGQVDVEVFNSSTNSTNMMTTFNDGYFMFQNLPFANNYTVTPEKDINPLNGVTTYDLVLISQHILGITPLDSPYKIIAADATNDASVTTFDIVELRRLILNIITELPNNNSWRFVDKSYTFPNANNPFNPPYPEVMNINNLTQDELFNDFVGVKIGDVTEDVNVSGFGAATAANRNIDKDLVFDVADQQIVAGETYTVDFRASDFNNILGYQYTLTFDQNVLDFIDLETGNLEGLSANNFGLARVAEGTIVTSWNQNDVTVKDDAVLFSLTFTAKANGQLSELMNVTSQLAKAEAYNNKLEIMGVALRFNGDNGSTVVGGEFALYQNQPNPFKAETVIGFNLPQAATATLKIYDVAGKVLKVVNGDYAKGYNNITIDRSELGAAGVLYYQLDTPEHSATKKMIIIE